MSKKSLLKAPTSMRISSSQVTDSRPSISSTQQRMSQMSLMGSTSNRSAGYGGKESMKDPRPITDKSYRDMVNKEFIEFMSSNGYPHNLTPKVLHSPSNSDFRNMVNFLIKFLPLQEDFQLGANFEDSFPELMNKIRYPMPISKRILKTVGVPHQWPQLLLTLDFMRVIIVRSMNDLSQLLNSHEQAVIECMQEHYHDFLLNNKDFATISISFKERFDKRDDLKGQNDVLEREVEEREEEVRTISEELDKNMTLTQSKEKRILKMHQQKDSLHRKNCDTEEMLVHKNTEVNMLKEKMNCKKQTEAELLKQLDEVNHTLKSQECLGFDVHQLSSSLQSLQRQVQREQALQNEHNDDFNHLCSTINERNTCIVERVDGVKKEVIGMHLERADEVAILRCQLKPHLPDTFETEFKLLKDVLMGKVWRKVTEKKGNMEAISRMMLEELAQGEEEMNELNLHVTSSEGKSTRLQLLKQELDKRQQREEEGAEREVAEAQERRQIEELKLKEMKARKILAEEDMCTQQVEYDNVNEETSRMVQSLQHHYRQHVADLQTLAKNKRKMYRNYMKKTLKELDEVFAGEC